MALAKMAQRHVNKRDAMFTGVRAQFQQILKQAAENHTAGLKEIFNQFDANGDRMISQTEFTVGCRELGLPISPDEVAILFPYFDDDGSGDINMDEFLAFVEQDLPPPRKRSSFANTLAALKKDPTQKKLPPVNEMLFPVCRTSKAVAIGNFKNGCNENCYSLCSRF